MSLIEDLPEPAKARWHTASRFADVLDTAIKARGTPLAVRVVTWFNLCRLCQALEEELLLAPKPAPADVQLHRALLSQAIGSGEGLLLECTDPNLLSPLGVTPESIAAKLDSLRITFEQWHTPHDPERDEVILREVFNGPT